MRFLKIIPTLVCFIVVATSASVHAQSLGTPYWRGVTGDWSNANNWTIAGPTSNGSRDLGFRPSDVVISGTYTANNNLTGFTATGITFDNLDAGPTGFHLSGNQITLGGNIVTLGNTGTPTHTISLAMSLNGNRTITTEANNNLIVSGSISEAGGSRSLTKEGGGTLTLSGANSFTGQTLVSNGTLAGTGANAFGSTSEIRITGAGTLSLRGDSSTIFSRASDNSAYAITTTASGATINVDQATVAGTGAKSMSIGALGTTSSATGYQLRFTGANNTSLNLGAVTGTITTSAGTVTIINNISGGGNLTIASYSSANTSGGETLSFSGSGNTIVTGAVTPSSTTLALTKTGTGTLTLNGSNSYTGNTTINGGTVVAGHNSALGTAGTVTLNASDTTLSLADGVNISRSLVVDNNGSNKTLSLQTGATSAQYSGGITINESGAGDFKVDVGTAGTLTVAGSIGGTGAAGLTKSGAGMLVLSGSNSYSGATVVSSGALNIQHANALGATTNGTTVNSGAALQIQGGITTAAEGLTLNGTGISNTGALRNISSDNTYSGAITLGSATRINSDAGTLTLNGGISGAQNLTVGGNGNTTISGAIATGTGSLTKDGAGTLILSGANTYTGTTTVNAGTLRVNGSLSTGNVTIASGATLGGSGAIGGATTISGIHSPGNSPGLQTFNGGLTYLNGSSLTWELAANTISGRGANFDGIDVTGGVLTINPGVTSNLVFNASGSLVDWSNVFWAVSQQWLVYDNANAPTLGNPIFTTINVSNDMNNASLGSIRAGSFFSWVQSGSDIFLRYNFASAAAVPEPGTFGLMGLAGLIGVLRHRRRRKEMSQV